MGRFRYENMQRPGGGVITRIIDEEAESAKEQAKAEIQALLSDGLSAGDTAFVYRYIEGADVTVAYYERSSGENYWLITDGHTDTVEALFECITALHRPGLDDMRECYRFLDEHLDDCDCEPLTE